MNASPVRQNIIETASKLFYHKGYNLTGINEIIKEAGIAKATLYHHFKSKEDICLAYLMHRNEHFLADIQAFIAEADAGDHQVLALFDFLQLFFKSKDFNGCWCINTISEIPKENERIRAEIQKQKIAFIQFIEQLIKNNLPKKKKAGITELAKKVYLLYETAVSESHLHQADWPIVSAKDIARLIVSN